MGPKKKKYALGNFAAGREAPLNMMPRPFLAPQPQFLSYDWRSPRQSRFVASLVAVRRLLMSASEVSLRSGAQAGKRR